VIDYTQEKFVRKGVTYDIIMDSVGKMRFHDGAVSLAQNGVMILNAAMFGDMFR
jgi:NADPH:quinone reductase-like Zn-dependent oxidoreductase